MYNFAPSPVALHCLPFLLHWFAPHFSKVSPLVSLLVLSPLQSILLNWFTFLFLSHLTLHFSSTKNEQSNKEQQEKDKWSRNFLLVLGSHWLGAPILLWSGPGLDCMLVFIPTRFYPTEPCLLHIRAVPTMSFPALLFLLGTVSDSSVSSLPRLDDPTLSPVLLWEAEATVPILLWPKREPKMEGTKVQVMRFVDWRAGD